MKKLLISFAILALVACSTIKTGYDYDRGVDFTKYKTYQLNPDQLVQIVGQLNRDRIIATLEKELVAKGFTKAENADLIVDVFIKSEQKVEATATTSGGYGPYGGYRYGGGFSTTQISYDEYTEGTMFISFVDKSTEKLVWQGTGTKTIAENTSAEKKEQNITYAIHQILLNYPAKGK